MLTPVCVRALCSVWWHQDSSYALEDALLSWVDETHRVRTFVRSLEDLSILSLLPHSFKKDSTVKAPTFAARLGPGPARFKRFKPLLPSPQARITRMQKCRGRQPATEGSSSSTVQIVRANSGDDMYSLGASNPAYDSIPQHVDTTSPDDMVGRKIAHWFQRSDDDPLDTPRWYISTIVKQRFVNRKAVAWWCRYEVRGRDGKTKPEDWSHWLRPMDYGKHKLWVFLEVPD